MTAGEGLGSVDELADGTGGSADAVTGGQSVHIENPGLDVLGSSPTSDELQNRAPLAWAGWSVAPSGSSLTDPRWEQISLDATTEHA